MTSVPGRGVRAESPDRGRRPVSVAAALTSIVAIVVGAVKIGRSFDYDEAVTYALFVNGGSPSRALTTQFVFNNHQTFSVIQAIAWRIGLVGETSQRLLPVMCGVATVGLLTWWVGNRTGALAGAFAGLFLLLNPVFVAEFRTAELLLFRVISKYLLFIEMRP